MMHHPRPGSRNAADGLPASAWPTVLHRVLEKKEPLRKVAEDDGVSHETRRRVVRAARCGSKASVRTERPRSHHRHHKTFFTLFASSATFHCTVSLLLLLSRARQGNICS